MNQYPNGPQQPYQQPNPGYQSNPGYPPPGPNGYAQYPPQGQPQYPPPGYPQGQPMPQQPPRELIKVRCAQGRITVTDHMIKIGLWGQERSLSRAALTGVDYKLVVVPLFGMGGAATLVFHGQGGERMIATLVKPSNAKAIKQILGY